MKALSFSAVEILPALLKGMETNWKKGKNQTIRKAWEDIKLKVPIPLPPSKLMEDKPPKFKSGEIIQIMWHQRSSPKGSWFCKDDGVCYEGLPKEKAFPKILGKVKITEVFDIILGSTARLGYYCQLPMLNNKIVHHESRFMDDLYQKDGFKSAEDMFKWFDSRYDLSIPKPFYVYRWEGL